uniref:Uncharacterized protein n=1 Tax=Capitella teleta TaxID=283909 RepID=X2AP22_CAPTE
MGADGQARCSPSVKPVVSVLFLFLIVILLQCKPIQSRNLPSVDLEEHARRDQRNPDHHVLKITRMYHLFNQCAKKYVQITDRNKVDARGRSDSPWATLLVRSVTFESTVQIQSNETKMFLCFNKKGRLTVRRVNLRVFTVLTTGSRHQHHQSIYRTLQRTAPKTLLKLAVLDLQTPVFIVYLLFLGGKNKLHRRLQKRRDAQSNIISHAGPTTFCLNPRIGVNDLLSVDVIVHFVIDQKEPLLSNLLSTIMTRVWYFFHTSKDSYIERKASNRLTIIPPNKILTGALGGVTLIASIKSTQHSDSPFLPRASNSATLLHSKISHLTIYHFMKLNFEIHHHGNSRKCQFKEVLHNAYREFHSVYNKSWMLGFKKSGSSLGGQVAMATVRPSLCIYLTKAGIIRVIFDEKSEVKAQT